MDPSNGPAARLDAASDVVRTGIVGTTLAGPLIVKAIDAKGHPVQGATVTFAITQGNGSIAPRVATTDQTGTASATWVLGNTVGINEVTAAVAPLATPIKFTATAGAGPVAKVTISPQPIRFLNGVDSLRLTTTSLDGYGNVTAPTPTLASRDPSLVSIDARGFLHVVRRGGSTYVIASAGGQTDSALVTVLAIGESLCTGVVAPTVMAVGQVITDVTSGNFCVHASGAGEEYAIIPYYNSSVPSALTQVEVRGANVVLAPPASTVASRSGTSEPRMLVPDDAFEDALRRREREIMTPANLAAARRESVLRTSTGARASISVAVPAVGDLVSYNVNALENCAHPDFRTGRVAAVTNRAIVVADTANPTGGFTDEQYRSIGVTFDTLVDPVDVAAFGEPGDIDSNGRSILFFTRAINALTPRGSSSLILGLFYGRDLTPKSAACPGSNAAEMFYLLVPDPEGTVSDARTASTVVTYTNGTVAHEYQHLINASRRSGGNPLVENTEEAWLNEGLSHIAEELVFFRSSGLSMRTNLTADAVNATTRTQAAFSTYEANNFARFRRYVQSTESQAPISSDGFEADLQTRGAIWSFLRYAADRQPGGDGTLWYRLVNSTTTGMANLTAALGTDPAKLLRDWAVSLYVDDNAPNVDPRFQQPSWNMRNALALVSLTGTAYPLSTGAVLDNA